MNTLTAPAITGGRRLALIALRGYLLIAMAGVIFTVVQVALGH